MNNLRLLSVGAFFFFSVVVCFSHLHQGTLAVDAIRYASISQNLLDAGDPLHLYDSYEERSYVNKPPLLFWLTALSFKVLGFSTFAAKAPAVFFAFLALLILFLVVRELYSETAAWWAALLLISNRSFQRDLLEFGFDGLAVFGALCCLSVVLKVAKSEKESDEVSWVAFGIGLLVLLQSKPPYVLFVLAPAALWAILDKRFFPTFFSRNFILGVFPPVAIGLMWFVVAGSGYFVGALENQVGEAVSLKLSFLENLGLWFKVFFSELAPLSVLALFAVTNVLKRAGWRLSRLSSEKRLLLLWSSMLLPIMFVVSARGRYLWVPVLALLPLSAEYLASLLPRLREVHLKRFGIAGAFLLLILVFGFNVRMHRQNPVVDLLNSHPDLVSVPDAVICVDGDREYRNQRMAKYSKVLLELNFGQPVEVLNSNELPLSNWDSTKLLLVESNCKKSLDERKISYDVVAEAYKSALLRLL